MVLEASLRKASQEASKSNNKWPLDDLSKELHLSLTVLSQLLQGKSLDEGNGAFDPNLPPVPSEGSQSHVDSSVAVKASTSVAMETESSSEESSLRGPSRNRDTQSHPIGPHQLTMLRRVVFALCTYKRKIQQLRQLMETSPDLDLHKSLYWNSMLHFEWSADRKACLVSATDSSLMNECGYSDVASPFLAVPQSEKALHSILQAVQSHTNVLLTGYTVRKERHSL